MAMRFSTDDVHPRDRLAYWREVATKGFVRNTFVPTCPQNYRGEITLGMLGELGVADYECDPGLIGRSAEEISSGDCDDLLLCVQVRGLGIAAQDGRQSTVPHTSFCLLDPRRPFNTEIQIRSRSIIVQVPRQKLEVRLGSIAGITAHAIDAESALPALALGYLARLPSCLEGIDASAAAQIAEQTLDLVALAVSAETEWKITALSSSQASTLIRLKAEIEKRLSDPGLKPAEAAEATGISVRYANALLALEDTSLERYIVARRLERCRRALDDSAQAPRSIGEIAFSLGFSDLSHFSRRFRAEFGITPSEYRRRLD
jgi:AraC-like DNA-binding protein